MTPIIQGTQDPSTDKRPETTQKPVQTQGLSITSDNKTTFDIISNPDGGKTPLPNQNE